MVLSSGKIEWDDTLTPGSMAWEIERALQELVPVRANENPVARRKLALAIARGVILHLYNEIDAFHTTVANAPPIATHEQSPSLDIDLGGWS